MTPEELKAHHKRQGINTIPDNQLRRYEPLSREIITKVFKAVRTQTGDIELALSVSVQLQNYGTYKNGCEKYQKEVKKTTAEKLRDIAESVEDYYLNNG